MDVLKELKKWKVEIVPDGLERILIRCPLPNHEDANPSCQVRLVEDGKWKIGSFYCPVCSKGGDFFDLLAKITRTPASAHRKQHEKSKKVSVRRVEECHANLMLAGHITARSKLAKKELEVRGVSDDMLKRHMIGFNTENNRITIPIQWGDNFVNVLQYSPGSDINKFINWSKGYGKTHFLYPQDQLLFDKIILCGGPIKALATAQRMNQHGIGAVSLRGETKIPPELVPWFTGKTVWVCYDIDSHGQRFADVTCGLLRHATKWVGNLVLPLDEHIYPKGDLNDYFGPEESTPEELLDLLAKVDEWEDKSFEPKFTDDYQTVPIEQLCGFQRAFNFKTSAYLSGVDDSTAHKVPRKIKVSCTGDSEFCSACKLMRSATYDPVEGAEVDTEPKNPLVLSFVNIPHKQRINAFKEYFDIPELCNKCKFEPSEDMYTIRYVLLSDTETDSEIPISATVFTDGDTLYSGEACTIKGRVDQSPLTSEEVRIITTHEPKDILTQYVVRKEELLDQFRPEDDSLESLKRKIEDINFDLERNVTFIYERPEVHTLFDLCFHSPLWVPYDNSIEPGWVSVLLVSETAQGKSTIMRRLIRHYGHGTFIDAANTSIAGLVGGIKSIGKRQFVKWGILPQMDKRLVCIEEYANAPVELLRSMRAARDSGVVSMNKIDKGRANARTRTIVLSNPKKLIKPGVVIDGLSLLEDLVERPEDLRRFDVGMWIPRMDVETRHIAGEPKYSSEACHELITWAWTLPVENIVFTDEALRAINHNDIKEDYPYLYLVGQREFDVKLARLAAAVACRTYNLHGDKLTVELRHVHWVCEFLRGLYDDPEFGYSSRIRREKDMDDSCTIDQLLLICKSGGNPLLLCDFLMKQNRYTIDDLKAATGDMFAFEEVKNKLVILGCIVGEDDTKWNRCYLPTKRMKRLLPQVRDQLNKEYGRPSYLRKEGVNSI